MNRTRLAAFAFVLTACATSPPGEDPRGQELKARGSEVLRALIRFEADRGNYPSSLYELVPHYLAGVPFEPHLRFDEHSGTIGFAYSPSWPRYGDIVCTARVGASEWVCDQPAR